MIFLSPRTWLVGALLLACGAGLQAQGCHSYKCFDPAPIPLPGSSSGSSSNSISNIQSIYSHAQDEINNTVNQFRSILLSNQPAEAESGDNDESIDVPDNDTDSGSNVEADIEQLQMEREAREAAAAEQLHEQQRNQDAANLLSDANNLLLSANTTADCSALVTTPYPVTSSPPALPPQCMSDAEAASVYAPGKRPQISPSPQPEPVIDGSNIPSTIDFSPALQQLMNQTGVPPANGNGSDSSPLQNLVDETQPTGNEDPSATPSSTPVPQQTQNAGAIDRIWGVQPPGTYGSSGSQENEPTGSASSKPIAADPGQNPSSDIERLDHDTSPTGILNILPHKGDTTDDLTKALDNIVQPNPNQ